MRYDKHPYPSFVCGYTPQGQKVEGPKREPVLKLCIAWTLYCILIAKLVTMLA